jgi:threonine aldolase
MNPVSATQTISEPEKQPASTTAIDLRSDTVTRPSPEMRRAMAEAPVGDDVYAEDPTINKLQARAAEIFGREASIFVPSGSMGNLIAVKTWTHHGDEVIIEERGHIHQFEMDSVTAIAGCMPRTTYVEDGILTWDLIEPLSRPKVYPPEVSDEICDRAHDAGLRVHLDGARIFNAAVYLGRSVAEITRKFDSVMFCLSKGLGAPVGSMLVGSREFIEKARVYRKLFGGGMRQVGVLGAAGLIALEKSPSRLHEDHANARHLAEALAQLPGITVDLRKVQTNIIIFDVRGTGRTAVEISAALAKRNVLANPTGRYDIRMLTHVDVDRAAVDRALAEFRALLTAA